MKTYYTWDLDLDFKIIKNFILLQKNIEVFLQLYMINSAHFIPQGW